MRKIVLLVLVLTTVAAAWWCVSTWQSKGALTWEPVLALLPALGALLTFLQPSQAAPTSPPQVSVNAPVHVPINAPVDVNVPVNVNVNAPMAPQVAVPAQSDLNLLREFEALIPYDPTIVTMRDQDFGAFFRTEYLEPLSRFAYQWNDVSKEFLDADVEAARAALHSAARRFMSLVAIHTVTEGDFSTVFPEYLRGGPRPQHVLDSAQILNEAARSFMPLYEEFIRTARRKLALPAMR